jgi:hypothetical protein
MARLVVEAAATERLTAGEALALMTVLAITLVILLASGGHKDD